MTDQG